MPALKLEADNALDTGTGYSRATHASQGGIGGSTCSGGGVYRMRCLCFVACGMGATLLYDSLALDQVPSTLIEPDTPNPALHTCVCEPKPNACIIIMERPNPNLILTVTLTLTLSLAITSMHQQQQQHRRKVRASGQGQGSGLGVRARGQGQVSGLGVRARGQG